MKTFRKIAERAICQGPGAKLRLKFSKKLKRGQVNRCVRRGEDFRNFENFGSLVW
ncbi:Uncharacterized protein dnm_062070 [Desulfonema magnum]|uniref:Uncharacterized protein n=1 Tax=Desulfonema magnum TaxID=45655 RepID=A0A975GQK7_9BACT|nr:Uncharacterized protein dnm_062070 [Desulfonema magnum]